MLKDVFSSLFSFLKRRNVVLTILFLFLFGTVVARLYDLQIVHGEDYQNTFTYRIEKIQDIPAKRGSIYDKNGEALAYDRLASNIVIEDIQALNTNDEKNAMVFSLITLLRDHGFKWNYSIPIAIKGDGDLYFTGSRNTVTNFKKDVFSLNYTDDLTPQQEAMTAEEIFDYMCSDDMFDIGEPYSREDRLNIASIRYDMFMKRYMQYMSVTVAEDVDDATVAAVKENTAKLPGISIEQNYIREYPYGEYFGHITGYVGEISREELDEYAAEGYTGYSIGDRTGKMGLEAIYEHELAGKKGSIQLFVNNTGAVMESYVKEEAVGGNDIYLNIDAQLSIKIYNLLQQKIAGIILFNLREGVDPEYNQEHYYDVRDVVFSLIENNIIDIDEFSRPEASKLEKNFLEAKTKRTEEVIEEIYTELSRSQRTPDGEISDELNDYYNYIYEYLVNEGILDASAYGYDDPMFWNWQDGTISLGDFLFYAISKGWIKADRLVTGGPYPETSEAYNALLQYLRDNLGDDHRFSVLIYKHLLKNQVLGYTDVCKLLYHQGVFEEDQDYRDMLNGDKNYNSFISRRSTGWR
ncbi:MAG: hypothetical protein IJM62_06305 [Lachnospiraceae bacterium]|nr:hypothetical protein [Lachnospiraceae bacterium]